VYKKAIKEDYSKDPSNHISTLIDNFQKVHRCCGYNGVEDWMNSSFTQKTGLIPDSCCIKANCTTDASSYDKHTLANVVIFVSIKSKYFNFCKFNI